MMRTVWLLAAAGLMAAVYAGGHGSAQQKTVAVREAAYRANNLGVARLEQADFAAAVTAFRRALEIDPSLAVARLNLGIALYNAGDREKARAELEAARPLLPGVPHGDYMLGLIARSDNRPDDAIEAFRRVLKIDAGDPGANVNLGQIYLQRQQYEQALELFRAAAKTEAYNATAAYGLATALVRSGSPEGQAAMDHFQKLREHGYATTFSQLYLEQGRYAEGIASTGAEPGLVGEEVPPVSFSDATSSSLPADEAPYGAPVSLADLDLDGDLDLLAAGPKGLRVYRNTKGRLERAALDIPAPMTGAPMSAALPGDFDNDGRVDLLVLRTGGLALLRQEDPDRFTDASTQAGFASMPGTPRSAAWLDADHDGDLDIFVAMADDDGAANRLIRNNGNGSFSDVTAQAGLPADRPLAAVVPTDYDDRRDIDLLLLPVAGAPMLYRNRRDGSFADVAADTGLKVDGSSGHAAVADVNKDDYPDVFFSQPGGPGVLAISDGRGGFRIEQAPAAAAGATAAHFLDYDNDGLLDLFLLTSKGPRVLRNLGRQWVDVSPRAIGGIAGGLAGATSLLSGDLDGDGDVDLVVRAAAGLAVLRNDGGNRARALAVRLAARVSNRSAVGSKIEMRAGSLRQRHETHAAMPAPGPSDVLFGVGDRPGADVVRVLWPSGILQAEVAAADAPGAAITGTLNVEELDRKPSSCPYLFTWTGERFEFLTDFLGGGEMGYWLAPGVRNSPDADEYVRIPSERLKPRNGRYELRVTNELEEAVFLDRLKLVAVDHPEGVEVFPNEGLRAEPEPLHVYATSGARPPLAAVDDHGHDVRGALLHVDRRYPDDFTVERIRGYAAKHALTLTLPVSTTGRRVLLLTGWTDYAFSGDNVAAHQAGLRMEPPMLLYEEAPGRWRTAIENIGFPAGRPQTVPVDLTGRVPERVKTIRIVTTMRIYWDQALVDVSDGRAATTMTRANPAAAVLRWRGFSGERTPDGREPFLYAYEHVSALSPWKVLPGRYTREGDVRELLAAVDNRFVVSRPGDEVAFTFNADTLPPLRRGWTRTFLLYANGFSKEMDLNSSSPDVLGPLPFHGMPRYPFGPGERGASEDYFEYVERYNTRVVKRPVPPVEMILEHRRRQ